MHKNFQYIYIRITNIFKSVNDCVWCHLLVYIYGHVQSRIGSYDFISSQLTVYS